MTTRHSIYLPTVLMLILALLGCGCSTAPKSETERQALITDCKAAIEQFKAADPGLRSFFDTAYGYAVFPSVGKGGIGVGGAYGKGVLYEAREPVGYCSLSQATIGLQLGGQAYAELIFFQNRHAIDQFKSGNFALAAQASAVAATAGASADADYDSGVLIFTMAKGGLMVEASVGGQKFAFVPK